MILDFYGISINIFSGDYIIFIYTFCIISHFLSSFGSVSWLVQWFQLCSVFLCGLGMILL